MASDEAPQVELDESEDLEDLESEVREMSEKILRYRTTLQENLKNSFASLLVVQRPAIPEALDPGTSRDTGAGKSLKFVFLVWSLSMFDLLESYKVLYVLFMIFGLVLW